MCVHVCVCVCFFFFPKIDDLKLDETTDATDDVPQIAEMYIFKVVMFSTDSKYQVKKN